MWRKASVQSCSRRINDVLGRTRNPSPHHNRIIRSAASSSPPRHAVFFSTEIGTEETKQNNDIKSRIESIAREHINVCIIGGGIIGTSVAYHLAKLGVDKVVLLEKDQLTSGTTWHAAGLMTAFGSLSSTSIDMRLYSQELYRDILPEETGLETGFMDVGFIELASTPDRLHYFRRVAAFNRLHGVDVTEISSDEVQERFPLLNPEHKDHILAGFYSPNDGRANPTDVTMALAKGAKQNGVQILAGVTVDSVITSVDDDEYDGNQHSRTAIGVRVQDPSSSSPDDLIDIPANAVVNCAGMWARQLGEKAGVAIPNQAAEHYYMITDDIDGIDPKLPVIEDMDRYCYMRPEGKGLLVGFFEPRGASWNVNKVPNQFSFGEIEPDWNRMAPFLETSMGLLDPTIMDSIGIKKFFCGPESFTPDGNPILGEAPELRHYFIAAGLNSVGILSGGGIGKVLAKWIAEGVTPLETDITGIMPDRFHRYQSNPAYRRDRIPEILGKTYKVPYPDHQYETCRGAKKSPFHDRLIEQNAVFKDVSGWESPAWYASKGIEPKITSETFHRPHWFDHWAAEHNACRENVALFDMSFMSKFVVQGHDASSFLNYLSTANIDGPPGKITYTQWLDEQGFLQADLTITKLTERTFLVVATDTMHNKVLSHMRHRLQKAAHVFVTDVSGAYAQLNLQGPNSRELLNSITSRDMTSNFDFRHAEEIDIGLARALCTRITYVGELGYELFIPVEQATHVYDIIVEAGKQIGLQHAGLKALGSLRMEKGYRDYGHDIDNTDTILEAGLSFTCDFDKPEGFLGRDKVLAHKEIARKRGGLNRRLAQVSVILGKDDPLLYHGEVLWKDGKRISDIRSSSYGHTIKAGVGLTMLESLTGEPITKDYLQSGHWEIEVAEKRYPCFLSLRPLYDPRNERIKL